MPRAFAYLRVPTPDQTTDNQLQEIPPPASASSRAGS